MSRVTVLDMNLSYAILLSTVRTGIPPHSLPKLIFTLAHISTFILSISEIINTYYSNEDSAMYRNQLNKSFIQTFITPTINMYTPSIWYTKNNISAVIVNW